MHYRSLLMASGVRRSNYEQNALCLLGFFCVVALFQKGNALQYALGGADGWTVPKNGTKYDFNQWAERTRFQIGDSLLFVYKPDQDSVLLVKKEDYDSCTTTAALASYNDGHTEFKFNRSGYFYFISGNKDNCLNKEKLIVAVLADRSNRSSNTNGTTTASPPPAPSADTGMVPSPTPSGEEAPTPSGEEAPPSEINPTPSPSSEKPNAASSIVMVFSASVGAFIASYLVLVC